ncbi:restriction endonuclease [Stackebrandtia albiflava]|uniref:Restriction endonuclease n=2 Tax=Stackebrandtia albiflava TaxID=406432 RepID=A0A562VH43_9ACTN|nr:restriction endonuclease [Stackebrandtia albiflava]
MPPLSLTVKIVAGAAVLFLAFTGLRYAALWVAQHWVPVVVVLALVALAAGGVLLYRHRRNAAERAEDAELERHLAKADTMTIPEFEAWVAKLLLRDGFRQVRFVGRAADFGSNFVATAPDSRRVMVRAKPDDGTMSKRGARHIQALGADAHARWKADTAMLITNADLHRLKVAARHDALAAQLGVILVDRMELAAWVADRKPPAELTASPA